MITDDVLATTARWCDDGPVALATVTGTSGSAARAAGAAMAVSPSGEVAGSVSSGCVEATVFELAREALRTGTPGLHRFGVPSDGIFDVGLTCGGEIEVLVQRVGAGSSDGTARLAAAVAAGDAIALVTVLEHPDAAAVGRRIVVGPDESDDPPQVSDGLTRTLTARAQAMLSVGADGQVTCGPDGSPLGDGVRAFVQTWSTPPRLLVFGAVDFAASLAAVGRLLGHEVTVCDARPTFTTAARFPQAHHVVVQQPQRFLDAEAAAGRLDERTAVVVLTHDARFDVPVLRRALAMPLAYVGAMGSRRTHDDRVQRLRDVGVTPEHLARLRSPIGLDLGARSPEETALSIVAEMVADRRGGTGRRLSGTGGPIHGDVEVPRGEVRVPETWVRV